MFQLKEIEKKLNDARRHLGKTPVKLHQSIEGTRLALFA